MPDESPKDLELDLNRPISLQVARQGDAVLFRIGGEWIGCDAETARQVAEEILTAVALIEGNIYTILALGYRFEIKAERSPGT